MTPTPTAISVGASPPNLSPIHDEHTGNRNIRRPHSRNQETVQNKNEDLRTQYASARAKLTRMRRDSDNNKKMLLEMSGVIRALQGIDIAYERDAVGAKSATGNILRKINAIDHQLQTSAKRCVRLEEENLLQTSTIRDQQEKIGTLELCVGSLEKQLGRALDLQHENECAVVERDRFSATIRKQEDTIRKLEEQLAAHSEAKKKVVNDKIDALKESNDARYAEIELMERRLQAMRSAQTQQPPAVEDVEKAPTKNISFISNALGMLARRQEPALVNNNSFEESHHEKSTLTSVYESDESSTEKEDDEEVEEVTISDSEGHSSYMEETASEASGSIQISPSTDESVEIMVGKAGNVDVSDVSHATPDSTVTHVDPEETLSGNDANLREQLDAALAVLKKFEAEASEVGTLREEHRQALAKVALLEESNGEMDTLKENCDLAEARVAELEQNLDDAVRQTEAALKAEANKALHVKDLIYHYKALEKEHLQIKERLNDHDDDEESNWNPTLRNDGESTTGSTADRSPSLAKYLCQIEDLQFELSKARKNMEDLEKKLNSAKNDKAQARQEMRKTQEKLTETEGERDDALRSQKARERDLRVVLAHYKHVQKEYEGALAKVESLEAQIPMETVTLRKVHSEEESTMASEKEIEPVMEEQHMDTVMEDPVKEVDADSESVSQQETAITEDSRTQVSTDTSPQDPAEESPEDEDVHQDVANPIMEGSVKPRPFDEMDETEKTVSSDNLEPSEVHEDRAWSSEDDDSIAQLLQDMKDMKQQREEAINANLPVQVDMEEASTSSLDGATPAASTTEPQDPECIEEEEMVQSRMWELEEQEEAAQAQLEITERKLSVAQREALAARQRQTAREHNVRDLVAQQMKMDRHMALVQQNVMNLQEQLEQAKRDAKLREQDTKAARQRAADYHSQFKKLQGKHKQALSTIEKQEQQLQLSKQ